MELKIQQVEPASNGTLVLFKEDEGRQVGAFLAPDYITIRVEFILGFEYHLEVQDLRVLVYRKEEAPGDRSLVERWNGEAAESVFLNNGESVLPYITFRGEGEDPQFEEVIRTLTGMPRVSEDDDEEGEGWVARLGSLRVSKYDIKVEREVVLPDDDLPF